MFLILLQAPINQLPNNFAMKGYSSHQLKKQRNSRKKRVAFSRLHQSLNLRFVFKHLYFQDDVSSEPKSMISSLTVHKTG